MKYKKFLMRLTFVFIGVILFLTFFSRTLVDMHVPRVALAFIEPGVIRPEAHSSGIVEPAESTHILAPVSGRITHIMEIGENISNRSVIFTIAGDIEPLEDMLAMTEHEREHMAINIERTQAERAAERDRERIRQIDFTLRAHNLEMERIEQRIYDLTEKIEYLTYVEVMLPQGISNQTVTKVFPDIAVGTYVHEGTPIMITSLRNSFIIEASFPQIHGFIRPGLEVEITIGRDRIESHISQVVPAGGRNIATIELTSMRLSGGELAMVTVLAGSSSFPSIIPIGALRRDNTGYFILYVESEPLLFGNSYYARIQRVEVNWRDANHTAISGEWGAPLTEEPVIIASDVHVNADGRVRLVAGHE